MAKPDFGSAPAPTALSAAASSDSEPILQAEGLTKRYGGIVANDGIDLTIRQGELRGLSHIEGLDRRIEETLALVHVTERAGLPISDLAYGEKRRPEIGLALAAAPSLVLLDEPLASIGPRRSPPPT